MRAIFTFLVVTSVIVKYAPTEANPIKLLPNLHICRGRIKCPSIMESCIQKSIESLKPYLADGIPELIIPRFDPCYLQRFELNLTHGFIGNVTFQDIFISGLTNFDIIKLEVSRCVHNMKFDLQFPLIEIKSYHDINGMFLGLPLKKIRYRVRSVLSNIIANISMDGGYYIHNKQEFSYMHTVVVKLDITNAEVDITDYDNYNNVLHKVPKKEFNLWKTIESEMLSTIETFASKVILETTNKFYMKFPLDVWMPL